MFKYFVGVVTVLSVIGVAETVVNEWAADKRAKRNAMLAEADARNYAIRKGVKEAK